MKDTFYTSHILDNGLTVLLRENHSEPIISHWIWYRVGLRNEVPGKTGISHFVEHMQFRGTKRFPGLKASREISRNGGIMNGCTSVDWTAYCLTLPSAKIDIAIDIETDRMRNSLFIPEEVESERMVILSEKEGEESYPELSLIESMRKAAFPHHPYGVNTIGETEDLLSISRDDLYEHYHTWYVPNNAVVVAVGDFMTEEMLRRIEAAYGSIPARSVPELNITPEGQISGPLKIKKHGLGNLTNMRIFWHVPSAKNLVTPALMLLNCIITRPA